MERARDTEKTSEVAPLSADPSLKSEKEFRYEKLINEDNLRRCAMQIIQSKKRKASATIAVILQTAGLREIFVPIADWHIGSVLNAAFWLPLLSHLVPVRYALKIEPLSMSAVIRLTAAAPATLIGAYWAVRSDDVTSPFALP